MTPTNETKSAGELYEKCVSLGLCERAKFQGDRVIEYRKRTLQNAGWWSGLLKIDDDMASDLCCMSVLRALDNTNHVVVMVAGCK